MTAPTTHPTAPPDAERGRNLIRVAIWVAIGALIAAAIVCVVWVLIGPENGIIGRAFLTILLLAAFAGVAILDAHLAPRRPAWFALLSMIVWVVILLDGALLIWMPEVYYYDGFARFLAFLTVVLVLQLAVLHVRLYLKAYARHVTVFTRIITIATLVLVGALAVMLVVPLTFFQYIEFEDLYWRIVVAITILAAVGTALIPLMNVLFAPKKPRPAAAALPPWPTYGDGVTPLPVLPDGSPDWNAYYTGTPSYPAQQAYPPPHEQYPPQQQSHPQAPPAPAPQPPQQQPYPPQAPQQQPYPPQAPPAQPPHPGYQGYPPPPAPPQ